MTRGRLPKITSAIEAYIDSLLKAESHKKYEQIVEAVKEKFTISVSKASISKRAKALHLGLKRGRKRIPKADKMRPSHSMYLTQAGAYFLKAAELESGLLSSINQIFNVKTDNPQTRKVIRLAKRINALLLYAPLYGLTSAGDIAALGRRELRCIAEEDVIPSELEITQYINYLASNELLLPINKEVMKSCQGMLYVQVDFANTSFYLDGQGRTVWGNTKIPANYSTTLYKAIGYVNSLVRGCSIKSPLILQTAPGYTFLPTEAFNLIRCLDRAKFEAIPQLAIASSDGVQLAEWKNIKMGKKGYFIFPLTPWQYERLINTKVIHDYKPYRIGYNKEPMEVADAQISLFDTQSSENIKVRAALIKRKGESLALVTNISRHDERYIRKIADMYFYRWPDEKVKTFYDIMEEAHEEMGMRSLKRANMQTLLDGSEHLPAQEVFARYLEYLHSYTKFRFFSSEVEQFTFKEMREKIYSHAGFLKEKRNSREIILTPFSDENLQNSCKIACQKFNQCGVKLHNTKELRIYLQDNK